MIPVATKAPAWLTWLGLEAGLLQTLAEPERPWYYLEAALVLSRQDAKRRLAPTSLEAARPHRLLPVTGAVDRRRAGEAADDLRIRFKDRGCGWITLTLRLHGRHHEVSLSDVYDPLADLVDWMEACLDETRPALVAIHPEGGAAFLALRPCATPGQAIFQYLESYRRPPLGQAEVARRPFVAAFPDALEHLLARVLDLEDWGYAVQQFAQRRGDLHEAGRREDWQATYREELLGRIRAVRARMAGLGNPVPGGMAISPDESGKRA